ncbi:MAG: hypothetical protein HFJ35_03290 [Clostridia bacterium]|nr:hypothetical protein [Clostridia bacterium]
MNIFLQPAGESSKKQLDLTMSIKENLENLENFITKEQYHELNKLYPDKQLNMWGVTMNKENVWKQMQIGDFVLFYGNKNFFIVGTIQYKLHNRKLAKNIWGSDNKGLHWEYIYCLGNVQNIHIPLENFNHLTGYEFKQVQGAMMVKRKNATEKILKEYKNMFHFDYEEVQKKEEESKSQELSNKIWNLNIQNATHNFKIVTR